MTSLQTLWLQTLWLDFLYQGICEFLTQNLHCSNSERGEVIASSTPVLASGSLAEDNPARLCNVFTQTPQSDQVRPCIEKVASDQTKPFMLSFQRLKSWMQYMWKEILIFGFVSPKISVFGRMTWKVWHYSRFCLPPYQLKVSDTKPVDTKFLQNTLF